MAVVILSLKNVTCTCGPTRMSRKERIKWFIATNQAGVYIILIQSGPACALGRCVLVMAGLGVVFEAVNLGLQVDHNQ